MPALLNWKENVPAFEITPLSNTEPELASPLDPLVTVWSIPPLFVHVTVVPTATVSVDGEKLKP